VSLREAGTERPFTGEYNDQTEPGIYVDIVSGEPLFASSDKFESGCGWPSFTKPIVSANINELRDTCHGMIRTEVSVVSFRLASHRSALPRFSRACHSLRRFSAKVHQFWVTESSALLRFGNRPGCTNTAEFCRLGLRVGISVSPPRWLLKRRKRRIVPRRCIAAQPTRTGGQ
jgi:hypothetical protein